MLPQPNSLVWYPRKHDAEQAIQLPLDRTSHDFRRRKRPRETAASVEVSRVQCFPCLHDLPRNRTFLGVLREHIKTSLPQLQGHKRSQIEQSPILEGILACQPASSPKDPRNKEHKDKELENNMDIKQSLAHGATIRQKAI